MSTGSFMVEKVLRKDLRGSVGKDQNGTGGEYTRGFRASTERRGTRDGSTRV